MTLTKHASDRVIERMGINKKSVDRVAHLALERGYAHSETKGNLNKFINKLFLAHGNANNIKVYNSHAFMFINEKLVTVIKLPTNVNNPKFLFRKEVK